MQKVLCKSTKVHQWPIYDQCWRGQLMHQRLWLQDYDAAVQLSIKWKERQQHDEMIKSVDKDFPSLKTSTDLTNCLSLNEAFQCSYRQHVVMTSESNLGLNFNFTFDMHSKIAMHIIYLWVLYVRYYITCYTESISSRAHMSIGHLCIGLKSDTPTMSFGVYISFEQGVLRIFSSLVALWRGVWFSTQNAL